MKKELSISKELFARKYKLTGRFWYFIYFVVMGIFKSKKYNDEYIIKDDIRKCKGPAFMIFNHLSRLDHVYTMKVAYPRRVNMLAAYSEFFRSHIHWAFKMNNVLPKKNFTPDPGGIKAISQIIKKGGIITFAPEALASNNGQNMPICPGTGHMFKHYKIPVYLLKLEGQYLQNTKVCLDERHGKTKATLSLLFSPEDLAKLSEEEIETRINEEFRHDEYEWQKEHHYKWETYGRMAQRLEDICYKCPKCGKELTMFGEGNDIKCLECGNGASIDEYYDFHPYEGAVIPESPSKWTEYERREIIKEIRQNPNYSFTEHIKLGTLPDDHYITDLKTSEICGEGDMTIDHNGVHYVGTRFGEDWKFDLSYKQIYTFITEVDSSYFDYYIEGRYYDFFPERKVTYKMILLVEEMHRLHVNTWKNFPWKNYLYEDLDK